MTAQIAVFNLNGVAVASDSTATVSSSERTRTVTGAQKLFDLGPGHHVVAMTSGEARFMRVPYAVLIPRWRDSIATPLAHVGDYAQAFLDWLPTQRDLYGPEGQERLWRWMLEDYYLTVRSRILRELRDLNLHDAPWDDASVSSVVNRIVVDMLATLESRDDLHGLDPDADHAFLSAHDEVIAAAFDYVFDDTPRTITADEALLTQVPRLILTKLEPWSLDSTVAFIGYGTDDAFPGHQVLDLTGMLADRLLYSAWEPAGTHVFNTSLVTPLAQSEAIQTFLRAYNNAFPSLAHDRLDTLGQNILDLPDLDDDTRERISELINDNHQGLTSDIESHSWEHFISPMLATVESLPVSELARMAESLVGIQALRSHSSDRQPSVGGTIAVVTIAPDTGVTWHRHHSEPVALT
jgi:hypothetical protein